MRVFFAIDLPLHLKEAILQQLILPLKKEWGHGVRWVNAEHLHITLQFQKNLLAKDIPKIIENVKKELKNTPSFDLEMGELEFFPDELHPKMLAAKVGPPEDLHDLATKIGIGIQNSHYSIETRPFRAHLTLGRLLQHQELPLQKAFIPQKIVITEITLFQSQPSAQGSCYIPLAQIDLK